jgi:hypothetical protein
VPRLRCARAACPHELAASLDNALADRRSLERTEQEHPPPWTTAPSATNSPFDRLYGQPQSRSAAPAAQGTRGRRCAPAARRAGGPAPGAIGFRDRRSRAGDEEAPSGVRPRLAAGLKAQMQRNSFGAGSVLAINLPSSCLSRRLAGGRRLGQHRPNPGLSSYLLSGGGRRRVR